MHTCFEFLLCIKVNVVKEGPFDNLYQIIGLPLVNKEYLLTYFTHIDAPVTLLRFSHMVYNSVYIYRTNLNVLIAIPLYSKKLPFSQKQLRLNGLSFYQNILFPPTVSNYYY